MGRYSLVNHVIARTRYKKENSIEPSGLDFNKLDRFKSILEGRMLNARDINLYLLRVLLKYYVKMFLYENVTNKTSSIFTTSSNNPLENLNIDNYLNSPHTVQELSQFIKRVLDFNYLNLRVEISGKSMSDTGINGPK